MTASLPAREPSPLDAVAEQYVRELVELDPDYAIWIGVEGRTGEYADHSPAGLEARVELARRTLAQLAACESRDEVDEVTRVDLSAALALELEQHEAGLGFCDLNVIASPAQGIRESFDLLPAATEHDWAVIATRLGNVAGALRGYEQTLREGIHRGIVPARRQVAEVAQQARRHGDPLGFFADLARDAQLDGDAELSAALRAELDAAAARATQGYADFAAFLETELAPAARDDDAVGRELYALHSRGFLGATVDLDETYEWGVEELARTVDEQSAVAQRIVPGGTIADAVAALEADPARKLHGADALRAWMQEVSDRAVAELAASHFDIPEPVRRLECRIAPTQDGGIYYTGPSDDFSRPGRMWWSIPEGVTEFDTWRELTTVYHEGVPGHHLQIGQATVNRDRLNTWRRQLAGTSGHAEGWALYAERLMAELGYLDDPADRLGMLDAQRMRAARVVLDIGVHLRKPKLDGDGVWDHAAALEFLRANVTMNDAFIRFEVNRYLGWPGQAPSYKIGQRIWQQLRDDEERRLGAAFSLRDFHRRALDLGGVGLDTLRTVLS